MSGDTSAGEIDRYSAKAYTNGYVTGEIEDVPAGNISEFLQAHLTGSPWEPEEIADSVVVKAKDETGESGSYRCAACGRQHDGDHDCPEAPGGEGRAE